MSTQPPPPPPPKVTTNKIQPIAPDVKKKDLKNIQLNPVDTTVKTEMDLLSIEERLDINPFSQQTEPSNTPKNITSEEPTGPPPTPPSPSKLIQNTTKKKIHWSVDLSGQKTLSLKDLKDKKSCDLSKEIRWNKMKGMSFSEAGSAGVFFCLLEDDTVVVVKGNSTIGEELFASEFAPLLEVLSPKMRLVEYCPKRFPKASLGANDWQSIKRELPKHAGLNSSKVTKELDRGFFLLMEFVPNSVDMLKVEKDLLESEGCLKDIGRIMIMDLVINNWDRFSCIPWHHEGNPSNILFQKDIQRCVAIDQATTPIFKDLHKEGYENYLVEVKRCVTLIKGSKGDDDDPVDSICKMFENHSSLVVSDESKKIIRQSMKDSIEKLIKITRDELANLKTKVEQKLTGSDWADVYRLQMKNIDIDFMMDVINTIKPEYQQ